MTWRWPSTAETCSHRQSNKSRSQDSCVLTDPPTLTLSSLCLSCCTIVVLFYILFVSYRSMYYLCVNVYCTSAPGDNPIAVNKYIISYHIVSYHISYHILYHISYHIYHTISYILSYIVSYHISYHIIYHIISYIIS